MRKSIARILVTSVAAAAVIALSATAAFAAPTFSISPGGKYTAKASKTILTDNNSGAKLTCSSATAKGKLKVGKGLSGKGIGTVTASAFKSCKGPLGLVVKVKQVGTWSLNLTKYSSKTGVSTGYLSKIDAKLSATGCAATVTGSADATFKNSTGCWR